MIAISGTTPILAADEDKTPITKEQVTVTKDDKEKVEITPTTIKITANEENTDVELKNSELTFKIDDIKTNYGHSGFNIRDKDGGYSQLNSNVFTIYKQTKDEYKPEDESETKTGTRTNSLQLKEDGFTINVSSDVDSSKKKKMTFNVDKVDVAGNVINNVGDGQNDYDAVNKKQLEEVRKLARQKTVLKNKEGSKNFKIERAKGNTVGDSDSQEWEIALSNNIVLGNDENTQISLEGEKSKIHLGAQNSGVILDGKNGEIIANSLKLGHLGSEIILDNDKGESYIHGTKIKDHQILDLQNKSWDAEHDDYKIVSGRAATEDQLKLVNKRLNTFVNNSVKSNGFMVEGNAGVEGYDSTVAYNHAGTIFKIKGDDGSKLSSAGLASEVNNYSNRNIKTFINEYTENDSKGAIIDIRLSENPLYRSITLGSKDTASEIKNSGYVKIDNDKISMRDNTKNYLDIYHNYSEIGGESGRTKYYNNTNMFELRTSGNWNSWARIAKLSEYGLIVGFTDYGYGCDGKNDTDFYYDDAAIVRQGEFTFGKNLQASSNDKPSFKYNGLDLKNQYHVYNLADATADHHAITKRQLDQQVGRLEKIRGDKIEVTENFTKTLLPNEEQNGVFRLNLNDIIKIGSEDTKQVRINGAEGKLTVSNSVTIDGVNQRFNIGALDEEGKATDNTVLFVDGKEHSVNLNKVAISKDNKLTGLTNTEWDMDNILIKNEDGTEEKPDGYVSKVVKDRAATEGQLEIVAKSIKNAKTDIKNLGFNIVDNYDVNGQRFKLGSAIAIKGTDSPEGNLDSDYTTKNIVTKFEKGTDGKPAQLRLHMSKHPDFNSIKVHADMDNENNKNRSYLAYDGLFINWNSSDDYVQYIKSGMNIRRGLKDLHLSEEKFKLDEYSEERKSISYNTEISAREFKNVNSGKEVNLNANELRFNSGIALNNENGLYMNGKAIHNVAKGTSDNDVATMGQLNDVRAKIQDRTKLESDGNISLGVSSNTYTVGLKPIINIGSGDNTVKFNTENGDYQIGKVLRYANSDNKLHLGDNFTLDLQNDKLVQIHSINMKNDNTITGLSNTNWDMEPGKMDDVVNPSRAATEAQLKIVSDSISSAKNDMKTLGISVNTNENRSARYNLGKTINIKGTEANIGSMSDRNIKTFTEYDSEGNHTIRIKMSDTPKFGEVVVKHDVNDTTASNKSELRYDGLYFYDGNGTQKAWYNDTSFGHNEGEYKNIWGTYQLKLSRESSNYENEIILDSYHNTFTIKNKGGQQVEIAPDRIDLSGMMTVNSNGLNMHNKPIYNLTEATRDDSPVTFKQLKEVKETIAKPTELSAINAGNIKLTPHGDAQSGFKYDIDLGKKIEIGSGVSRVVFNTDDTTFNISGKIDYNNTDKKLVLGDNRIVISEDDFQKIKIGSLTTDKQGYLDGLTNTGWDLDKNEPAKDSKIPTSRAATEAQLAKVASTITNAKAEIEKVGLKVLDSNGNLQNMNLSNTLKFGGTSTPANYTSDYDKENIATKLEKDESGNVTMTTYFKKSPNFASVKVGDASNNPAILERSGITMNNHGDYSTYYKDTGMSIVTSSKNSSLNDAQLELNSENDKTSTTKTVLKAGNLELEDVKKGEKLTISPTQIYINNGPTISTSGINMNNGRITGLQAASSNDQPVILSQLNAVKSQIKDSTIVTPSGTNNIVIGESTYGNGGKKYSVDLANKIQLGNGNYAITMDGSEGNIVIGDNFSYKAKEKKFKVGNMAVDTSLNKLSFGDGKVTVDGNNGYIEGLKNTTWNIEQEAISEDEVKRAATMGQLQVVSNKVKTLKDEIVSEGIKFAGNQGEKGISLGTTVNIKGGGSSSNDYYDNKNIRTIVDDNTVNIMLAKAPEFAGLEVSESGQSEKLKLSKTGMTLSGHGGNDTVYGNSKIYIGDGNNRLNITKTNTFYEAYEKDVGWRGNDISAKGISLKKYNSRYGKYYDTVTLSEDGLKILNGYGPSVLVTGIDMNGKKITNLGTPENSNDAVNLGLMNKRFTEVQNQLNDQANKLQTEVIGKADIALQEAKKHNELKVGANLELDSQSKTATDGKIYDIRLKEDLKLGEQIKLNGSAGAEIGDNNLVEFGNIKFIRNLDSGKKDSYYITGLSNVDWTVDTEPVTGRAATEDQLAKVASMIKNNGSGTGGTGSVASDYALVGKNGTFNTEDGDAYTIDQDGVLKLKIKDISNDEGEERTVTIKGIANDNKINGVRDDLQGKIDKLNTGLETANTNIETKIDKNLGGLTETGKNIIKNVVREDINVAKSGLDAKMDGQKAALEGQINSLSAKVDGKADQGSIDKTINAMNNTIDSFTASIEEKAKIVDVEKKFAEQYKQNTAFINDINKKAEKDVVDGISTDLKAVQAELKNKLNKGDINQDISEINTRINTLNKSVEDKATQDYVDKQIGVNETQIKSLEKTIKSKVDKTEFDRVVNTQVSREDIDNIKSDFGTITRDLKSSLTVAKQSIDDLQTVTKGHTNQIEDLTNSIKGFATEDYVINKTNNLINRDLQNLSEKGKNTIKSVMQQTVDSLVTNDKLTTELVNVKEEIKNIKPSGDSNLELTTDENFILNTYESGDKTTKTIKLNDKVNIRGVQIGNHDVHSGDNNSWITGLTNKSWTGERDGYKSGRAATEDQLYQVDINKADITGANIDMQTGNTKWAEKLGIGKIEKTNNDLVTGATVYDALEGINEKLENVTGTKVADKANKDASDMSAENITLWQKALGTGLVEDGNNGLVTGTTVNKAIELKLSDVGTSIENGKKQAVEEAKQYVNTEFVKVSEETSNSITSLEQKINKNFETKGTAANLIEEFKTSFNKDFTGLAKKDYIDSKLLLKADVSDVTTKIQSVKTDVSAKITTSEAGLRQEIENAKTNTLENSKTYTNQQISTTKADLEGQLQTLTDTKVKGIETELNKKADKNGNNINISSWTAKLGTGKVESLDGNLVTGGVVYDAIKNKLDKSDLESAKESITNDVKENIVSDINDTIAGKADKSTVSAINSHIENLTKDFVAIDKFNASVSNINNEFKNYAKSDASNISAVQWASKLGTDKVALDGEDANKLITSKGVAKAIAAITGGEGSTPDSGGSVVSVGLDIDLNKLSTKGETRVKELANTAITDATLAIRNDFKDKITAQDTKIAGVRSDVDDINNKVVSIETTTNNKLSGFDLELSKKVDTETFNSRLENLENNSGAGVSEEVLENIKTELKGNVSTVEANFNREIGTLRETHTKDVSDLKKAVANATNGVDEKITASENKQIDSLNKQFESLEGKYDEKLANQAKDNLLTIKQEVAGTKDSIKADYEKRANKYESTLDTKVSSSIATAKKSLEEDISRGIDGAKVDLNSEFNNRMESAEETLTTTIKGELNNQKTILEGQITEGIRDAKSGIQDTVDRSAKQLEQEITKSNKALSKEIEAKNENLGLQITNEIAKAKNEFNSSISAEKDKFDASMKEKIEAAEAGLKEDISSEITKSTTGLETKISTELKTATEQVEGKVTTIDAKVNDMESKVNNATEVVNGLNAKVEANAESAKMNKASIEGLSTKVTANENALATKVTEVQMNKAIEAAVKDLSTSGELEGYAKADLSNVDEISESGKTAIKDIVAEDISTAKSELTESINTTKEALQGNIDTLSETVSANKTATEKGIKANVEAVEGLSTTVNANAKAIEDKVWAEDIDTAKSELNGAIATAKEATIAKAGELDAAMKTELTESIKTTKDALQGNIDTLSETVSTNKAELEGKINDVNSALGENITKVGNSVTDLTKVVETKATKTEVEETVNKAMENFSENVNLDGYAKADLSNVTEISESGKTAIKDIVAEDISTAKSELNGAIATAKEAAIAKAGELDAAMKTELTESINTTKDALQGNIDILSKTVSTNKAAAEKGIKANTEAVEGLSTTVNANAKAIEDKVWAEDIKTAKSESIAEAKELDQALETKLIGNIETVENKLTGTITEKVNAQSVINKEQAKTNEELGEIILSNAKIIDANKAETDKAIAGLTITVESNKETLQGNIDTLSKTVKTNKEAVEKEIEVNAKSIENLDTTVKADSERIKTNKESIEGLSTKVSANAKAIEDKVWADDISTAKSELNGAIATAKDAAITKAGELDAAMKSELTESIKTTKEALQGNINTLSETVSTNKSELEGKINDVNSALGENITKVKGSVTDLTKVVETKATKTEVEETVNKAMENFSENVNLDGYAKADLSNVAKISESGKTAIKNIVADDIDTAKSELNGAIATAKEAAITEAGKLDAAMKTELTESINTAQETLQGNINTLSETVSTNKAAAEKGIKANTEAVDGLRTTVNANTKAIEDKVWAEDIKTAKSESIAEAKELDQALETKLLGNIETVENKLTGTITEKVNAQGVINKEQAQTNKELGETILSNAKIIDANKAETDKAIAGLTTTVESNKETLQGNINTLSETVSTNKSAADKGIKANTELINANKLAIGTKVTADEMNTAIAKAMEDIPESVDLKGYAKTNADNIDVDKYTAKLGIDKINDQVSANTTSLETKVDRETMQTAIKDAIKDIEVNIDPDTNISGLLKSNLGNITPEGEQKIKDIAKENIQDVTDSVTQVTNKVAVMESKQNRELAAMNDKLTNKVDKGAHSKAINDINATIATKVDAKEHEEAVNDINAKLDQKADALEIARIDAKFDNYVDKEGNDINVDAWVEKLSSGDVESGNNRLVTGDKVHKAIVKSHEDLHAGKITVGTGNDKVVIENGEVRVTSKGWSPLAEEKGLTMFALNAAKTYRVATEEQVKTVYNVLDDRKLNIDGSNLTDVSAGKFASKLGVGKVENGNTNLVTGSAVAAAINKAKAEIINAGGESGSGSVVIDPIEEITYGADNTKEGSKEKLQIASEAFQILGDDNISTAAKPNGIIDISLNDNLSVKSIKGLENTSWEVGSVVADRAATEGQLQTVESNLQSLMDSKVNTDLSNITSDMLYNKLAIGSVAAGNNHFVTGGTVHTALNTGLNGLRNDLELKIKAVDDKITSSSTVNPGKSIEIVNGKNTTVREVSDGKYAIDVADVDLSGVVSADELNGVKDKVDDITTKVNTNTDVITTVKNKVTDVVKDVADLDSKTSEMGTDISNLEDKANIIENSVTEVNDKVVDIADKVTGIDGKVTNIDEQVTKIDEKVDSVEKIANEAKVEAEKGFNIDVIGTDSDKSSTAIKGDDTLQFVAGDNIDLAMDSDNKSVTISAKPSEVAIGDVEHLIIKEKITTNEIHTENRIVVGKDPVEGEEKSSSQTIITDGKITGLETDNITDDKDATNKEYVDNSIGNVSKSVGEIANSLQRGMAEVQNEVKSSGALQAALAGLKPLGYNPFEKTQVMAAVGHYKGKNATALGLGYHVNEDLMINTGASFGSGNSLMVNAGVTWRVGSSVKGDLPEVSKRGPLTAMHTINQEVSRLQNENNEIRKENFEIKELNRTVEARCENLEKENEEMKKQIQALMDYVGMTNK